MDTAEPRYLTADQIATELGVDVQTVQRLFRDGDLPGRKIGRGWRANRTDLDAWIRAGNQTQPGPLFAGGDLDLERK